MSWQLVTVKILGGIIAISSICLLIYLIKVIDRFDFVAVLHMMVPVITFPAGIGMLFLMEDSEE